MFVQTLEKSWLVQMDGRSTGTSVREYAFYVFFEISEEREGRAREGSGGDPCVHL